MGYYYIDPEGADTLVCPHDVAGKFKLQEFPKLGKNTKEYKEYQEWFKKKNAAQLAEYQEIYEDALGSYEDNKLMPVVETTEVTFTTQAKKVREGMIGLLIDHTKMSWNPLSLVLNAATLFTGPILNKKTEYTFTIYRLSDYDYLMCNISPGIREAKFVGIALDEREHNPRIRFMVKDTIACSSATDRWIYPSEMSIEAKQNFYNFLALNNDEKYVGNDADTLEKLRAMLDAEPVTRKGSETAELGIDETTDIRRRMIQRLLAGINEQ